MPFWLVMVMLHCPSDVSFYAINGITINVSREGLKGLPMLRQMREGTLHQILHVRVAKDTQRFSNLIGPYKDVHYEVISRLYRKDRHLRWMKWIIDTSIVILNRIYFK